MANNAQSPKRDFFQELTDKITHRIQEGIECEDKGLKWEKPIIDCDAIPYNPLTWKAYSGANMLNLASEGYADPRFLTFNQMKILEEQTGGNLKLKKGSKASLVLKTLEVYEKDEKESIKKDGNGDPLPVLDKNGNKKSFIFHIVYLIAL